MNFNVSVNYDNLINTEYQNQQKRKADSDLENASCSKLRRTSSAPIYIKLEEESPMRSDNHDESSYDSFHDRETDVCKDSSDESDGSERTEGFATMEFFEYEVHSTSDDDFTDSDDNSNYSSSGSDGFVVETAKRAYYYFNGMNSDDEGNSEYLLADTEESDEDSIDAEIGFADYWECVKCKNKQNNPLYRYCEKCYQVRKSLFPPRPRQKKKLQESSATKRKMDNLEDSESLSSSDEYQSSAKKQKTSPATSFRQQTNDESRPFGNSMIKNFENNKQKNSAGEFSSNDKSSSFEEEEEECSEVDDAKKLLKPSSSPPTPSPSTSSKTFSDDPLVTKIKMSSSSSIEISKVEESTKNVIFIDKKSSHAPDMVNIKISNKELVYPPLKKFLEIDSGCSTAPSSQELMSSQDFGSQITIGDESAGEEDEAILQRVESFSKNQCKQDDGKAHPLERTESVDLSATMDENESKLGLCRFCFANPKNGVFVHSNSLHLCCCYKCAVKVWKKRKSCPICNCKIKNVTKLFVH